MLVQRERGIEDLSDQYGGRIFGYSEVNRKTLAQTSAISAFISINEGWPLAHS